MFLVRVVVMLPGEYKQDLPGKCHHKQILHGKKSQSTHIHYYVYSLNHFSIPQNIAVMSGV